MCCKYVYSGDHITDGVLLYQHMSPHLDVSLISENAKVYKHDVAQKLSVITINFNVSLVEYNRVKYSSTPKAILLR